MPKPIRATISATRIGKNPSTIKQIEGQGGFGLAQIVWQSSQQKIRFAFGIVTGGDTLF